MLSQAASDQAPEVRRRLAHARARHEQRRSAMPAEDRSRWFHLRRDQPQRRIRSLTSPEGWADGVDPTQIDLRIEARLEPPQPQLESDATKGTVSASSSSPSTVGQPTANQPANPTTPADPAEWDAINGGYQGAVRGQSPAADVLLASQGDPLVIRLRHPTWPASQIIVVVNGSFLLNLPLVNRENRKLASRLIDAALAPPGAAPGQDATDWEFVVLESEDYLTIRTTEPSAKMLSGLEFLQRWPLAPLSVHLLLALMLACFVFFPIFGRPRALRDDALSDFGRHVNELGRLLETTNDVAYARGRLDYYLGGGRREAVARTEPPRDSESKSPL
jgi:hypothetical protein